MKKLLLTFTVSALTIYGLNAQSPDSVAVKPGSTKIEYEGRIGMKGDSVAEMYWPGSSLKISFRGTGMSVVIQEQSRHNYYTVTVDGDNSFVLRTDSSRTTYKLASDLKRGKHTVQLFRRTGWTGVTRFYGAAFPAGTRIEKPDTRPRRRIEFYGNSITVGSGMYDKGEYGHENNYMSYAAVTARHFNAHYTCIARSGIGMVVSWFPMIMPELYNRLNAYDSASVWDFSKLVPDVVVVNLFQNDYSIITDTAGADFKNRFGSVPPTEDFLVSSYRKFIQNLRNIYPRAYIICVLGNMDATSPGSPFPGYIQKAVDGLNDKKIYAHFFAYKNTPEHPNEQEHNQMATSLIDFIDKNVKW